MFDQFQSRFLMNCSAAVAMSLTLISAIQADTDIDYDDGVVTVTTDDHDDYILIRQEGSRLAIRIFQMDEDFFDSAMWARECTFAEDFEGGQYTDFDVNLDWLDDFAEDTRVWKRNINNVNEIRVFSQGGNDVIAADNIDQQLYLCGGDDGDYIHGSLGRCIIFGEDGDDIIKIESPWGFSSHPSSLISGGRGEDLINSGSGNDVLWGGDDDDLISGRGGDDTIYGGDGNDQIHGGNGNDEIFGQAGADLMYGESGNDYLEGGYDGDIDYLAGGSGFDEGIKYYYRYPSRFSRNKKLIINLETESSYEVEIKSGIQK